MEPLIGLLLEVLGEFLFRLGCLVFGSASFLVFFYAAYSAKKGPPIRAGTMLQSCGT
jgi:hypothetical protein